MAITPCHISHAKVDRSGRGLAVGHIDFPLDDDAQFPRTPHDHVALAFDHNAPHLSLIPTLPEGGPPGHLIATRDTDLRLFLPLAFVPVIKRVLRYGCKHPIEMALENIDGTLRRTVKPHSDVDQTLNDWRLHIEEDDGDILLDLSAALNSGTFRRLPFKEETNHWSLTDSRPPRLTVALRIDLITRAVKWSAYDTNLSPDNEAPMLAHIPRGNSLELLDGLFAHHDNSIGLPVNGMSADLYIASAIGCFFLTPCKPPAINACGFTVRADKVYPGIRVDCVSFENLLRALTHGTSASLQFKGDNLGTLAQKAQRLEDYELGILNRPQVIKALTFDLDLDAAGLHLAYTASAEEETGDTVKLVTTEGAFHLSWPTIIVKFPILAHQAATFDLESRGAAPAGTRFRVPDTNQ